MAIDWSGRLKGAGEFIWRADVQDGQLIGLENGLERNAVIAKLFATAKDTERLVVGLDFAFSAPSWWMREQGFAAAPDLWRAAKEIHAAQLAQPEPPFWGHLGPKRQLPAAKGLRETERQLALDGHQPKSVFQLGGAGAVGTGSLRGMAHLLDLQHAGFSVWPFDPSGWPRVIEIYPRLLTGPVDKRRFRARYQYLGQRFPDQDPLLRERAAGSEDAFDAAVSALTMAEHLTEMDRLAHCPDEPWSLEGAIWRPTSS